MKWKRIRKKESTIYKIRPTTIWMDKILKYLHRFIQMCICYELFFWESTQMNEFLSLSLTYPVNSYFEFHSYTVCSFCFTLYFLCLFWYPHDVSLSRHQRSASITQNNAHVDSYLYALCCIKNLALSMCSFRFLSFFFVSSHFELFCTILILSEPCNAIACMRINILTCRNCERVRTGENTVYCVWMNREFVSLHSIEYMNAFNEIG